MEHIIQFGVTIDDKRIEDEVIAQTTRALRDQVEKLGRKSSYLNGNSDLTILAKEVIKEIVDEHKDEIIEKAVAELVKGMLKTKAVKEAMGSVITQ